MITGSIAYLEVILDIIQFELIIVIEHVTLLFGDFLPRVVTTRLQVTGHMPAHRVTHASLVTRSDWQARRIQQHERVVLLRLGWPSILPVKRIRKVRQRRLCSHVIVLELLDKANLLGRLIPRRGLL